MHFLFQITGKSLKGIEEKLPSLQKKFYSILLNALIYIRCAHT